MQKINTEESSLEDEKEGTTIKNPGRAVDQIKEEDEETNSEDVETTSSQETEEDDEKKINKTKKTGIKNPVNNPGDQTDEEVKRVIDMNPTTMQEKTKRESEVIF